MKIHRAAGPLKVHMKMEKGTLGPLSNEAMPVCYADTIDPHWWSQTSLLLISSAPHYDSHKHGSYIHIL